MAETKEYAEDKKSGFFQAVEKVFGFFSATRLFFAEIKESITQHLDWTLRRMEYIFVIYLWASVGILLMVLGIFDLLVEFCHIPRGIVLSLGGLLIFLVAVIFLQAVNIKRRGK